MDHDDVGGRRINTSMKMTVDDILYEPIKHPDKPERPKEFREAVERIRRSLRRRSERERLDVV